MIADAIAVPSLRSRRVSEHSRSVNERAALASSEQIRPARQERRSSFADNVQRWIKCPSHGGFVYSKILSRNLNVCPECDYHFRIGARERLDQLCDRDSFAELSGSVEPADPLEFADSKPYSARIRQAQSSTGLREAAVYGTAQIYESSVVIAAMDFDFIGGSMGSAVGEIVTRAAETAAERRLPLLVVCASGGARMQEGCVSLIQMIKTSAAIAVLAERRLPYLVLLTDPTFGGVSASFASLGDVLIAEPGAKIGFAGRRVIENTVGETLPSDFQSASLLLERGLIDMIVPRGQLRKKIGALLRHYESAVVGTRQTAACLPRIAKQSSRVRAQESRDAWDVVQAARNQSRPRTLEYIDGVFDEFHPLSGDRQFKEDAAVVGGLVRLGELRCMAIGTQKGRGVADNLQRNFGMPHPEGYRKALRLMQHAQKFQLPVITFVDTPGAFPGAGAEQRGQTTAIANNLLAMSRLSVPILTLLTGEGGSGGALALAAADRVLILENAYLSVISPEGCSAILFKNKDGAARAARALAITPHELKRLEIVDAIVPEPQGGAGTDVRWMRQTLRSSVIRHLAELLQLAPSSLVAARYARYRKIGSLDHARRGSCLNEAGDAL